MTLWHVKYFEPKAIKNQQTPEKFTSPLTTKNNLDREPGPERGLIPEITLYLYGKVNI